jgi:hypothetical protein
VSGEVSYTVAWDVVCPVNCRVLWLGILCVRLIVYCAWDVVCPVNCVLWLGMLCVR